MKPTATEPPETKSDCSWLLFGATSAAFLLPLWLLSYITVYTQGEVMQVFFQLLVILVAICASVGFYRRRWGVWILVVCGGVLISWQSFQVRKWAMLHEDIQEFVRHAEKYKVEHGDYPATISDYKFSHEMTRSHIHMYGLDAEGGFYIYYFLNHPGITYWYTPKHGYYYYPD